MARGRAVTGRWFGGFLTGWVLVAATPTFGLDIENEPIKYGTATPRDAIAELRGRLDSGASKLEYEPGHGYLRSLLKALDIPEDRPEALWDVPAERFVPAQHAVARSSESALNDISAFAPVYDADTVPLPLEEAFARGQGANVPLLLGTTRDEINLFLGSAVKAFDEPLEAPELLARLRRVVPGADDARLRALIETYRRSRIDHRLPSPARG